MISSGSANPPPRPPRPLRVLLVASRFAPSVGGIERHVERLAAELAGPGHAVTVWTHQLNRNDPLRETLPCGVVLRRFPLTIRHQHALTSLALARAMRTETSGFDVVHIHGYHDTPAIFAALIPHRRVVVTLHFHGGSQSSARNWLHRPYRVLMRRVLRRASALAYVSEAELRLAAPHFDVGQPTVITSNGVDLPEVVRTEVAAAPAHPREQVVVAIGRLERYKNVHRLIEAADGLPPSTRVRIAGNGPELGNLRGAAAGTDAEVSVLGAIDEQSKAELLSLASVGVSLSDHEAQGISVLEFLSVGLAVVASDIAAHREIAERYGRVVLVDPTSRSAVVNGIVTALALGRGEPIRVPSWSDTARSAERAYALAAPAQFEAPVTARPR